MTMTGRRDPVAAGGCVGLVGAGECAVRVARAGAGRAELAFVVGGATLGDAAGAPVRDADDTLPAVVCAEPDVHPAITDAARTATVADTIPERTGPP